MTGPDVVEPRPGVVPLLRPDEHRVLLVDLERHSIEAANLTAGMIWAACDGELTVAEVTANVAELFTTGAATIADDVETSIGEFRTRALLRTADDPPFRPAIPTLQPGPNGTPSAVPVPCRCGTDLDLLESAGTLVTQVGMVRLGIRFNTEAAGDRLRPAIERWLVDDDEVPAMYTVVLLDDHDPGDGTLRRSGLYEGRRWQNVGPDHDRIIAEVVRRLEGWEPLAPGHVRVDTIGVRGPQGVVLAPARYGLEAPVAELATAHEWTYLRGPVLVDADAGTVDGQPLVALAVPGSETARADHDDALRRWVRVADPRPSDDFDPFVDRLDHLARTTQTIITPVSQLTDVAAALLRSR